MRKFILSRSILFVLASLTHLAVNAEEIRDYYSEPGLHPFKVLSSDLNETIDPFSGTLQLRHTDVFVPGNGGMNIEVTRFYTNHQDHGNTEPGYENIYGIGWTMHFGRIVVPRAYKDRVCNQTNWSVTTLDNPSFEHPSGGRELLVLSNDGSGDLITKSNWRMSCNNANEILVRAPNGYQYKMGQRSDVALNSNAVETSWYTTEIKDVHNNAIQINYQTHSRGFAFIESIRGGQITSQGTLDPDGRLVQFSYNTSSANSCFLLDTVTSDGRTWKYKYGSSLADQDSQFSLCRHNLESVELPSNQTWSYQYYPSDHNGPGKYSVRRVKHPYGGVYEYAYQHVQFDSDRFVFTTAVQSKKLSGTGLDTGTWTYTFEPGSFELTQDGKTAFVDKTEVTQPDGGLKTYLHQGSRVIGLNSVWTAGIMLSSELLSSTGDLLEKTVIHWDKRLISDENYYHGVLGEVDDQTYAPIQVGVFTFRDGANYERDMSDFDIYGNPRRIVESSLFDDDPDKITTIKYFNNTSDWIIGVPEDESIQGLGTIDRTINSRGLTTSENRYGVVTGYTYYSSGDIRTVTDARNQTTTYLDYYRGIAREERQPEGITVRRVVNSEGTLKSITDGRNFTRVFSYDRQNRLTGIDYPRGADVSITWTEQGKTLVRGNFSETITFDGLGQTVRVSRSDSASNETITTTSNFDAQGRVVFESYPNSTDGTTYLHDAMGRKTRVTHPDGSFRSYAYGPSRSTLTDERGNQTRTSFRAYGHPDNNPVPRTIFAPENVCTLFVYNLLDQVKTLFQGSYEEVGGGCTGVERTFNYDQNYFLDSEVNPETGITQYGRDAVGNMISRQVGDSEVTTFVYDGRNRLTNIDYPEGTPDVTRVYDKSDNLTNLSNADATNLYTYDGNGNLDSEAITISGQTYQINYGYDAIDNMDSMTYPTGRIVSFSSDAFGRPTQAAPYINNVSYHPSGVTRQITYGNGQVSDMTLNDRLWIERIQSSGLEQAMDLTYAYDDFGNIESILDALNSANDRALRYDGLNRLIDGSGLWGDGEFSYDFMGNIIASRVGESSKTYGYTDNKLTGLGFGSASSSYLYDDYGNLTGDIRFLFNTVFFEKTFNYDDASHLRSASIRQGTLNKSFVFGYDGNGMRVTKGTAPNSKHYVYAQNGSLVGEYEPSSGLSYGKEYVYLGSQLIATAQENKAPTVNAGTDKTVFGGALVTLQSSGSDPDGKTITYQWQQTAGTPVTLTDINAVNPTFVSPATGLDDLLTFIVTVTDRDGATASDSVDINVRANTAPELNIIAPVEGVAYTPSQSILFTADATDNEDGVISSSISWVSDRDGQLGTGSELQLSLSEGPHQITATVIDSNDVTVEQSVTIVVEAPQPIVEIISPADGQVFFYGDSILFSATAMTPGGINLDDEIFWRWIGVDDGYSNSLSSFTVDAAPYTLGSVTLPAGTYVFNTFVGNSSGAAVADSVTIHVEPEPPWPVITQPSGGQGPLGEPVSIQVPFGEPIVFEGDVLNKEYAFVDFVFDAQDPYFSSEEFFELFYGSVFGGGDDEEELVIDYVWTSSIDGEFNLNSDGSVLLSVGQHVITLSVEGTTGLVGSTSINLEVTPVSVSLSEVSLSADLASPQVAGTNVRLTAQVNDPTGNEEYQFLIRRPGEADYSVIQDYSAQNVLTWDSSDQFGRNRFLVRTRNISGDQTVVEDNLVFWINDQNPAEEVSFFVSTLSPVETGAVVTLSADASGGNGNYEYQFQIKGPATSDEWLTLQNFSTSSTVDWDTSTFLGQNRLRVRARNADTKDRWVVAARNFWVNSVDAVSEVAISSSLQSPQVAGAQVSFSATTTNSAETIEYQFRIKGAQDTTWTVLQDYSEQSTVQWNSTGMFGRNVIQVLARKVSSADLPSKTSLAFWVNSANAAKEVLLSTDKNSPQIVDEIILLSAQGIDGSGNYEYQFQIKGDATNGLWEVLQDFSSSNTYSWSSAGYLGKNRIRVRARNAGSQDRWVADAQNFWINDQNAATGVSLSVNEDTAQPQSSLVILEAQGEGGTNAYDYQFRVRGPSTNNAWVVLQDFGPANSITWNTEGYDGENRVQVRARNSASLDLPVRKTKRFTVSN